MRVQVYKNLIRGDWSVRRKGKVIAHVGECVLANVKFHVGESSRQRVIAKRCREVHAWATGDLVETAPQGKRTPITYRPFDGATFIERDTGDPVHDAPFVHFTARGAVKVRA